MNEAIDIISDDFLRGQRDCMEGKPHQLGESESYDRGYGAEYESEQIKTEMSLQNEHH
jgi:hypothetical protein